MVRSLLYWLSFCVGCAWCLLLVELLVTCCAMNDMLIKVYNFKRVEQRKMLIALNKT